VSWNIPKGWLNGCLEDVVATISSGVSVNSEGREKAAGEIGILKTSCVTTGTFRPNEHKVVVHVEVDRVSEPVACDTVIVSRMNTPDLVGASAYIGRDYADLFLPDRLWQVRPSKKAMGRWLSFVIGSPAMRARLKAIASGTSNSMKNISQDSFLALPVQVPPIDEQRRIATVLGTWDEAIDKAECLITAKQKRFSAVRINLVEALQVAARGNNSWRPIEFGEIAEELRQRNAVGHGPDRVMGVIKGEGLVPMRAHVMASDLRRYLVVPPRAIAYNPMRLNIGSIAASRHDEDVLVSPDYVVFRARKGRADPDFLRFLIGTKRWRDHLITVGSGSVRTRIYFDGLAAMVLRVPDIREQKRIGQILAAMEEDLKTTIEAASALRTQKRGLVQKLLTGEWRLGEKFE